MRCYNKKCEHWTKTKCEHGNCADRVASKDKAVKLGLWRQTVTVHRIGTSLGVYLPKAICDRKRIEAGSELVVRERERSVELIPPPGSKMKTGRNGKARDDLFC